MRLHAVINILTYILSCTVSKLWLIIGQIFACDTTVDDLTLTPSLGVILANVRMKTRMIVLADSENRMIVSSFVSTKYRNVTEGQTDRQKCRGYYSASCIASNADSL